MSTTQSNIEKQWFYEYNGERKGGVSEKEIVALISAGKLGYGNTVWTDGFTNWVKLEDSPLKAHLLRIPPPLTGNKVNNTLVWVLAFAPFIGYMLEWMLAGLIHGNEYDAEIAMQGGGYWFVTLALNIALGIFDEKRLQKAGHDTKQFRGWVWLVPVYLYQRAKHLQQNLAYFIVWLICFGLVILAFTV